MKFNFKGWKFVCGLAAGLILPPVLKSNAVRKAAVNVTAKGMQLKDNATSSICSIKEEAQDIYAEAKNKNMCENNEGVS